MKKRVVIIGGGPGGYAGAIRAAQLGAEVTLVEKNKLGGVCLNYGCVPTKIMLKAAKLLQKLNKPEQTVIKAGKVTLDIKKLAEEKRNIVESMRCGMANLLAMHEVKLIHGEAKVKNVDQVQIQTQQEEFILSADVIVVATGSRTRKLPLDNNSRILTSRQLLALEEIPKSLLIVGGGNIGLEFAYFYQTVGCKVTVVEEKLGILSDIDEELRDIVLDEFMNLGIGFRFSHQLSHVVRDNHHLECTIVDETGKEENLSVDYILNATGRQPELSAINENMYIDENYFDAEHGAYFIGDCNGQDMQAHAAQNQGIAAIEHALLGKMVKYQHQPKCVFSAPEIATIGYNEIQCIAENIDYTVGRFPLYCSGWAQLEHATQGMFVVIAERKSKKIIGAQIVGEYATEVIGTFAVLVQQQITLAQLAEVSFPHPTMSEVIGQVGLSVENQSIFGVPKFR